MRKTIMRHIDELTERCEVVKNQRDELQKALLQRERDINSLLRCVREGGREGGREGEGGRGWEGGREGVGGREGGREGGSQPRGREGEREGA